MLQGSAEVCVFQLCMNGSVEECVTDVQEGSVCFDCVGMAVVKSVYQLCRNSMLKKKNVFQLCRNGNVENCVPVV